LLSGSHGTLGVITEVTLKVLPAPETTGTLVLPGLDAVAGGAALSAGLGSPFGVSAAAWLPAESVALVPELAAFGRAVALLRIEDFSPSVSYRTAKLRDLLGFHAAEILDGDASRAVWRAVRDAHPLQASANDAVWRVSVRPSAGPGVLRAVADTGASGFLDWGGGLVWLAGPADAVTHAAVEAAARAAQGTWTLLRGPEPLRAAVQVVPPEPPPLAAITRRVKTALDPRGILNPGRLYAGM
jgi:glycolate oxidase FAD binding subunit